MYRNSEILFVQSPSENSMQMMPKKLFEVIKRNTISETPVPILFQHRYGSWTASPLRYQHLIKTYLFVYENYLHEMKTQRDKLQVSQYLLKTL